MPRITDGVLRPPTPPVGPGLKVTTRPSHRRLGVVGGAACRAGGAAGIQKDPCEGVRRACRVGIFHDGEYRRAERQPAIAESRVDWTGRIPRDLVVPGVDRSGATAPLRRVTRLLRGRSRPDGVGKCAKASVTPAGMLVTRRSGTGAHPPDVMGRRGRPRGRLDRSRRLTAAGPGGRDPLRTVNSGLD